MARVVPVRNWAKNVYSSVTRAERSASSKLYSSKMPITAITACDLMHDRTNGFVERMNRTLLDECFRVQGRTKWHTEPDEIQRDIDVFIAFYNFERTHQGYRVRGRTPAKAHLRPHR